MEKNKQYIFSVWQGLHKHVAYNSLTDVYRSIKSRKYVGDVVMVRRCIKEGDTNKASSVEIRLPAFTASGTFYENKKWCNENLIDYTGLMVLNIYKLESEEKVKEIFEKATLINYTRMAFVSPSGFGIRIIVATNNIYPEQHPYFYKQLVKLYKEILQVEFDEKACDLTQGCFFSSDPNIYYNTESEMYEFEEIKENIISDDLIKEINIQDEEFKQKMRCIIEYTSEEEIFETVSRNDFTFLFAKNCCGFGLHQKEVEEYCIENFTDNNYSVDEVLRTVRNGYKYNQNAFGKRKLRLIKLMMEYKESKTQKSSSAIDIKDFYINKVVDSLPKDLTDIVENLETEKEKDAFFVGILSAVEILFKNLSVK